MKNRAISILATILLVLTGCGKKSDVGSSEPDDPTEYTIDVRLPGEGSTMRGVFKIEMKMTMDVRDHSGKPIPEAKDLDIKEEIGYRETIEAFPDGSKRPTKSRILIDKWEKPKGSEGIAKSEVMSRIAGREFVIEKRNNFYEFRATDGGPIDPNLRIFLDKRYSDFYEGFNIHDFLPDKPTKKYSEWNIPVERLVQALGQALSFPFDQQKSKGTGKLTSVFEKEGRKYGRIELNAKLVPRMSNKDVTIKEMKIDLKFSIETCIDGSRYDMKVDAQSDVSFEASHAKEGSGKITAKGRVKIEEAEEKIGKAAKPVKRPARKNEYGTPDTTSVESAGGIRKESDLTAPVDSIEKGTGSGGTKSVPPPPGPAPK